MTDPGLATAGAIVGLIGGSVAIITEVARGAWWLHSRERQREAETVRLLPEWAQHVEFSGGVNGTVTQYPVVALSIWNRGLPTLRDLRYSVDTGEGWGEQFELDVLRTDEAWNTRVPVVPIWRPFVDSGAPFVATEFPWTIRPATVSVSWRVPGTNDRSEPIVFKSRDYSLPA